MTRIASTILLALDLALIPCKAHGQGLAPPWAASEPVWQWDRMGSLWEAYALKEGSLEWTGSWPKTIGEICTTVEKLRSGSSEEANSILPLLVAECQEKSKARPASATIDVGAYPLERRYPLGQTFETFTPGWRSLRIDPELGETWGELPPLVKTELRYPVSPHGFVYFRLGLRRDLAAWQGDPLGLNVPLSDKEVDLNEPSLGYFHAENESFAFTVGRFQVHWSPSPDFGLALSKSVPYHDGVEFMIKTPHVRYRFLLSSLNPWLEGTPAGDSSSENYPIGSEEYRQRHYADQNQANNAHKRVYDDRIKTLIAHRLEAELGPASLGITETEVLGGKVPDLRDGNPFAFFHNDFKDGYTNLALSFDGSIRLPAGFSVLGELLLDDVQYTPTEGNGGTPSLIGYQAGIRHAFTAGAWVCSQSLQAVRTDPFLYGYLLPLTTMASRHVLTSNYYGPGDSVIVDKFVVDYPLGYLRGGDALDFWYRLEGHRGRNLDVSLGIGILSKGAVNLYTPYTDYYASAHDSPTGTAEKEVRARVDAGYRLGHGLAVRAGLAWQSIQNEVNVSGRDAIRGQASLGVSWSFPH